MATTPCIPSFIALFGGLCSFSVAVEVLEKFGDADSPTWSALKLMGPQAWSPIDGDPVRAQAALAILVFSVLYFLSCWMLDMAAAKENAYLAVPWLLCEGCTIIYQTCAAVNVADRFTKTEGWLLVLDTLLGVAAVGYVTIIAFSWLRAASSKRNHSGSADDAEATILHAYVVPDPPEGRPLLEDSQQIPTRVSEMAPKPWKPVEASMLEKLAVEETAGEKRVHFQTHKCSLTEEHRSAQGTQHEKKYMLADGSENRDRVVLSSVGANGIVRHVKPSNTVVKTVTGVPELVGNGATPSITASGNETNRQCAAEGCDYRPCKESILPSSRSMSSGHFELCTRSSSTERIHCDHGSSVFSRQEIHSKENIFDIPQYTEETKRNVCGANIYAAINEVRGELFACGATCSKTQFTSDGGVKSPNVCRNNGYSMERLRGGDSFIKTDSSTHNRNILDVIRDAEVSNSNGGTMCQQMEASSQHPPSLKGRHPGSKRPGNIWMYATPEPTKRSLLSGGKGLGYVHSASDMDLTVFAPKGCVYQCSSGNIGTSSKDSGGVVLHRMFTPRTDTTKSNSLECSISDIGPNKFLCWIPASSCPSLTGQSGSPLSQTAPEFFEECTQHKITLKQYSQLVPTVASVDRLYYTKNEMEYSSSRYERVRDALEEQGKKTASDPGVDTLKKVMVDNVRTIAKSFALHNLKLSEHWSVGETDSSTFKHALKKSSDLVTKC